MSSHNQRWHDYTGLARGSRDRWGWKVAYHPEDLEAAEQVSVNRGFWGAG